MSHHAFEDHTGELELRLEAENEVALFLEGASALAEILGASSETEPTGSYEELSIQAPDRDALMFEWLNELIYRAERDNRVLTDVRIDRLSDRELVASVRGAPMGNPRLQVKAATFHGLAIKRIPHGFEVKVVLDV